MKVPLRWWSLSTWRWSVSPLKPQLRNLKYKLSLKTHDSESFLCSDALIAQVKPRAPMEAVFPPTWQLVFLEMEDQWLLITEQWCFPMAYQQWFHRKISSKQWDMWKVNHRWSHLTVEPEQPFQRNCLSILLLEPLKCLNWVKPTLSSNNCR